MFKLFEKHDIIIFIFVCVVQCGNFIFRGPISSPNCFRRLDPERRIRSFGHEAKMKLAKCAKMKQHEIQVRIDANKYAQPYHIHSDVDCTTYHKDVGRLCPDRAFS